MPSAEKLLEALDSINCGVLVRRNDKVALVNERLATWLGYTREELVGMESMALVPPELREVMLHERQLVEEGDTRARLVTVQRKDSTTFPAVVISNALHDDNGELLGAVGFVIDLASVQTAKHAGYEPHDIRSQLSRIAFELQSLGMAVHLPSGEHVKLDHPELESLSPREREILAHLIAGERVPAIAAQLYISAHTVRNHLKSVYRKLEVGGQSDLIQLVRTLPRAS